MGNKWNEILETVIDQTQDSMPCICIKSGAVNYSSSRDLQTHLHSKVSSGDIPGAFILIEHEHVYTLGRRGTLSDILLNDKQLSALGIEIHHVDRGGQVTYHGPGQLVGYPIVNIKGSLTGPLEYIKRLERLLVTTLNDFGINADNGERPTGVWVNDAKIAAIGVKISRGVTTHGFALNINPDLTYFKHIVPCGMPNVPITSMSVLLRRPIELKEVAETTIKHFNQIFEVELQRTSISNSDGP